MKKFNLTTKPPHQDAAVFAVGNTENPKRALILVHGRFASASNILSLANELSLDEDVIVLAPEASERQWYPFRFIEPRESNEPHLSSALDVIKNLVDYSKKEYDIDPENVVLAGFSQGACLVAEYILRNPEKLRGVAIISGGLIGSDAEVTEQTLSGDFEGTPIYIGSDEADHHIPIERVEVTASALQSIGAQVDKRIYTGLGHSIHPDAIEFLNKQLA